MSKAVTQLFFWNASNNSLLVTNTFWLTKRTCSRKARQTCGMTCFPAPLDPMGLLEGQPQKRSAPQWNTISTNWRHANGIQLTSWE